MRFHILGPLEVHDGGGRPVDLGRRKQRALLAVLLTEADRVVPLDRLVDLLWPQEPPSQATSSLQSYISNLRRVLEPQRAPRAAPTLVVTQPPGYRLRVSSEDVDAARFEVLIAEADRLWGAGNAVGARELLQEALALWRGPALAEYADQPFARGEAVRLDELRLVARERLLEAEVGLGGHHRAVPELEALVAAHPLRERLWGLLMLSLYRSGRQGDALRAFQSARRALADQLGLEPGPALRALEADILSQAQNLEWRLPDCVPARAWVDDPRRGNDFLPGADCPLVGRNSEIAVLRAALVRAHHGRGGVVLVSGEPGIGKTRLAEELAASARDQDAVVAWGRCYQGQEAPPFWPWAQVVRALLRETSEGEAQELLGDAGAPIAQIVPEMEALWAEAGPPPAAIFDPALARFRLFEALSGFLGRLASRHSLIVVLDDLQWADAPTVELLGFLAQGLEGRRMLLIGTYRTTDMSASSPLGRLLAALSRGPHFDEIALGGLGLTEVGTLVRHGLGREPDAGVVATVHARTEGNPFFVVELLRLMRSRWRSGAGAKEVPAEVPSRVRQVLHDRLARLPEGTQELLQLAAVAGRDFDARVLEQAGGLGQEQTLTLIEAALLNKLISESPEAVGRLRFSHSLVHEVLYGELSALRRVRLHARVAEAIEEIHGGDAHHIIELAHHWFEAAPVAGPERAFGYALQASEAATAALAYEAAEEYLRRALALAESMPPGPEQIGRELVAQLRLAATVSTTRGWTAPGVGTTWKRAAELCQLTGALDDLLAALWGLNVFSAMRGDIESGEGLTEIQEMARESGDPAWVMIVRYIAGYHALHRGHLRLGREEMDGASVMAQSLDDDRLVAVFNLHPGVLANSGSALAWALSGEETKARDRAQRVIALTDTLGHPFTTTVGAATIAFSGVVWRDASFVRRRAEEALTLSRQWGFRHYEGYAGVLHGWAVACGGDPDLGVAEMEEALAIIESCGWLLQKSLFLGLLAEGRRWCGRLVPALAALEEALRVVDTTGERYWESELCRLRGELVHECWPERRDEVESWLRRAVAVAEEQGAGLLASRASAALARLADVDSDAHGTPG